jgi:AbrB family looped-hinge helix DNA binding protein
MGQATRLTRKGQVTIPKEVRDQLGLKPFDKIEFFVEDGEARLRKARFSIAELAGILPPLGIPVEEMPAIAREDWVTGYAEENT